MSEGGLGVAIAESVMTTENLGANVTVEGEAALLFSESQSRFVVSVKKNIKLRLKQLSKMQFILVR